MKIRKAVFPVGGRGTRFLPATKSIPKAMFPIIDKPIIHYIVEEAINSGIEQIIFVITPNNQIIEDYFCHSHELEQLLEQKGKTNVLKQIKKISDMTYFCSTRSMIRSQNIGLGIAILNSIKLIGDEPFAVFLPNDLIDTDIPCMRSLINIHNVLECPIIAVNKVPTKELYTYGNIDFSELDCDTKDKLNRAGIESGKIYEIKKLIQKPDPQKKEHYSNFAIIGRFILHPDVFEILQYLDPGYEGEVQLIDALEELRKRGQKIYAYEFDGVYYDTRSKLGYLKACINYALKQPELAKEIYNMISQDMPNS